MAEPIKMPFGVWSRVGPRNHILDGVQITRCKVAIFWGKREAHCKVLRDSTLRCAKMAEPIEMPFWDMDLYGPNEACIGCQCALMQPGKYD